MSAAATLDAVVEAVLLAASAYADARAHELTLEDERPAVKHAAITRLMQERGLAATPAEKLVETDTEYAAYRTRQRQSVIRTIETRALYEAARIRAWAAVRPAEEGF